MFYDAVAILIGLNFHVFMETMGMSVFQEGVEWYGIVHSTFWNSIFHTIFMPFTMFGGFLWIPALFNCTPRQAYTFRKFVMTIYVTHYALIKTNYDINCPVGSSNIILLCICLLYAIPYYTSIKCYKSIYYKKGTSALFWRGLITMLIALLIQEVVGHWVGGDSPSRLDAIPNAIVYAPYYSASHLFQYL